MKLWIYHCFRLYRCRQDLKTIYNGFRPKTKSIKYSFLYSLYSGGAQYVDRELPVDREGSLGRSHDIKKKIDVSLSSVTSLDISLYILIFTF